MITKEAWMKWRDDPVTRQFVKALYDTREQLKEGLADGHASTPTEIDRTIGQCAGIKDSINYAIYDFEVTEETEEEITNA